MAETSWVLVGDEVADLVAALDGHGWVDATAVTVEEVGVERLREADCLVVGRASLPPVVAEAVRSHALPVVAVVDADGDPDPAADWVAARLDRRRLGTAPGPADATPLVDAVETAVARETRRRLRAERDRIAEMSEATAAVAAVQDVESLYERVVDVAAEVLDADGCWVHVESDADGADDAGGDRLLARAGVGDLHAETLPVSGTDAGRVLRTGESRLVDGRHGDPPATPHADRLRSWLSVPIGEFGVFQAGAVEPAALDATDLELAELLCRHAVGARRRLDAETGPRRHRERVAALHDGTAALTAARSREALCEQAVEIAADVLEFERSYLYVADDEAGEFRPVAASVDAEAPVVPVDHGLMERTRDRGESSLVEDIQAHPVAADSSSYRSGMSIAVDDDHVLQVLSDERAAFDDGDLEVAELLCSYVEGALGRITAERERREEHDRLEALFENVPDAAVDFEVVDSDPVVRRVNSAFESQFGFDAETVVGENLDEHIIPPGGWSEADELNECLRTGQSLRTEVERVTDDGPRHFLLHVISVRLDATNVAGFAVYTDVTDRKRRERELRERNERLDEFASVVSHDLRNPLNVAAGYVDLVRDGGDPGQLDRAAEALERMDDLVTDLLTLAREGSVVGETDPVTVDQVVGDAWENVDTSGADAALGVDCNGVVDADRDRLCELLENLFHNAVCHGGGDVNLEVGTLSARSDGSEGFYVADDGEGIDDDIDPFETGVTAADNGTGFGLAIVERIAEGHGWRVDVSESEAGGARFEFVTE
ncbi:MAG: GAF domain-containing protein [Halolamina sp.]